MLQQYDPALHLERTITLLTLCLRMKPYLSVGLSNVAKSAARELAIQLNEWSHLSVLQGDPSLAAAVRDLFLRAGVWVPDNWCSRVRNLGLLSARPAEIS